MENKPILQKLLDLWEELDLDLY